MAAGPIGDFNDMDPVDSDDELEEDRQFLTKRSTIVAETSLRARIVPENISKKTPPRLS